MGGSIQYSTALIIQINILRPRQNVRHFADNILKSIEWKVS